MDIATMWEETDSLKRAALSMNRIWRFVMSIAIGKYVQGMWNRQNTV